MVNKERQGRLICEVQQRECQFFRAPSCNSYLPLHAIVMVIVHLFSCAKRCLKSLLRLKISLGTFSCDNPNALFVVEAHCDTIMKTSISMVERMIEIQRTPNRLLPHIHVAQRNLTPNSFTLP